MLPSPTTLIARTTLFGAAALSLHCAQVGEYCPTVGPGCGLNVDYEEGDLPVGTYLVVVETPAGVTTCDHVVAEPRRQTADEAEKQDEALVACGENDTCPEACSGPDDVIVRNTSLSVLGDAADITVTIENVETGALAEATFTPAYEDHPEACADCVTATASMPLPID